MKRCLVLSLAALAWCCGSDDDDGGAKSGAASLKAACYAMCDKQETGENCVPEYTKTCKQGCDFVAPGLADKCPDAARAYYECSAGIDYVCQLALPTAKDPNACKAEGDAMTKCTSG